MTGAVEMRSGACGLPEWMIMKHFWKTKLNQKGMTLAELLVTIIFISLLGLVVVGGIQAISRSYARIVTYSNAQVVLSDTMEVMRDQLLYTDEAAADDAGSIHFTSANVGGFHYQSGTAGGTENRSISITYEDNSKNGKTVPIVNSGMMTKNLYARIRDNQIQVDQENNTIQMTIEVCSTGAGENKVLASAELTVRPVNDLK
jgi:type II secretory pathway pseudopilin PulG